MTTSTILLVDDDEVLRQVLRRVLTRDGYDVVEASSVATALERAGQVRPVLGLLDLRLPDGDGVELAQQLKKQVGKFPLILMTASPLRMRDQPDLAERFVAVLTKPLNLEELRQTIEASLRKTRSASGTNWAKVTPPPSKTPDVSEPPPAPTPAASLEAPSGPVRRRLWRWAAIAGGVVLVAALLVAIPALGTPAFDRLLKRSDVPLSGPGDDSGSRLVPGTKDEIELPARVVQSLGVKTEEVKTGTAPRPLELAGSLAFDPNHLGRVQARFGGEVVSIGTTKAPDADGKMVERPLRYADKVTKGQIMAVVWSKDLGEKKSELVDSLVRLWYDESILEGLEELIASGGTTAVAVRTARTAVANDNTALARVERTLETWRVPQTEVDAIKAEARRVYERKGKRDVKKESEWAKVEVRAPFDGTIVEKNVTLGVIVDTTFDLYKVADLRKLGVMVHAYEEDLKALQALPRGFPWAVRAGADPQNAVIKSDGLLQIGLVVDPTQHTDPIMGFVDNSDGKLRVGQFVTATVNLPAPPDVVALPASALDENGNESVIFVQPDPSKSRYLRRNVSVAMRLRDLVYVRSVLREQDKKKGLSPLHPGEYVVTEGVVELKSALEDLQAKK
jgi:cobalt-zinc-cadmium efflux system membrane fusion protein